MSALSDKYHIPEPTVKKMINDGVISCTWAKYEEVQAVYQNLSCKYSGMQLITEVSDATKVPERTVYHIIARFR